MSVVTDLSAFRITISGGEPVAQSDDLFGDTIQLATNMYNVGKDFPIVISSVVDELTANDFFHERQRQILSLSRQDENLLTLLFNKLEENWQNPDFHVADYCRSIAMSSSQLYRKTMTLCGLSPVLLLKEFRLEKARELIKKQHHNISEITFIAGFTSPSYFTKCFKKKYNILPATYIELLN